MNNKQISLYIFTFATIILNLLMIFPVRKGNEDIFSNIFVILVTLFAFQINRQANKLGKSREVRPEFYGILFLFSVSLIRFANRITFINDSVNFSAFIIFIGAGTFLLSVAFFRIKKH